MDFAGRPADLVDDALVPRTRRAVCPRGAREPAKIHLSIRATNGRLAWAAKDKIVEVRRAPRYPVMVHGQVGQGLGVAKVSDLQAIRPGELKLVEGRLVTTLRRTVKEMPLCVSEAAFFEDPSWLRVGFELLQWLATFSRDYLLHKLKPDFAVFEVRRSFNELRRSGACQLPARATKKFREVFGTKPS